jgi:hypothetical protein
MKEEDILREFAALQSEVRKDKIMMELDSTVNNFVDFLAMERGWNCFWTLLKTSLDNRTPIFYSNYVVPADDLLNVLKKVYDNRYLAFVDILSRYVDQHQSISPGTDNSVEKLYELIRGLTETGTLIPGREVFEHCSNCEEMRIVEIYNQTENCPKCGNRIFQIFHAFVPDPIKQCIENGQYVELFVKRCLTRAKFHLIKKKANGGEVSTSIPYKIFGAVVEVDVAAVYGGSLLLCECKTNKITPNAIHEKLGQLSSLYSTLKDRLGARPDLHVFFITTGEIDLNVDPRSFIGAFKDALNLKDFQCIGRTDLPTLPAFFENYRTKLP